MRAGIAAALVCALWLLPAIRCGAVLNDDGVLWGAATRILAGQVPSRDFPVIYPPGEFYLVAGALAIGKGSWIAYRGLWLALRCLAAALAWSVARRFVSPALAVLGIGPLILVPGHWHKSSLALVPLAVLWAGLRWIERPTTRRLVALAAIIGSGCLLRHDIGGLAALAAVGVVAVAPATLWVRAGRVGLVALVSLALFGAVHALIGVSPMRFLEIPLAMTSAPPELRAATPYPALAGVATSIAAGRFGAALERSFYYWPFAVAGILLLWALLRRSLAHALLALIALAMLQVVWWYSNFGHLVQALPLALLATIVTAGRGFAAGGAKRLAGFAAMAAVAGYLVFQLGVCDDLATGATTLHLTRMTAPVETAVGEVRATPGRARQIGAVLESIDTATEDGDAVFVFPMAALYYPFSDRRNPTPFDFLGHQGYSAILPDPQAEQELARRIVASGAPLVLLDEPISMLDERRAPEQRMTHYAEGLLVALSESYTLREVIGTTLILGRRMRS